MQRYRRVLGRLLLPLFIGDACPESLTASNRHRTGSPTRPHLQLSNQSAVSTPLQVSAEANCPNQDIEPELEPVTNYCHESLES